MVRCVRLVFVKPTPEKGKNMKKKSELVDPHRPLTSKELKSLGPWKHGIHEFRPEIQVAIRRLGRPPVAHPKEKVTMRFDADIVATLRSKGKGWQTRLNAFLR